MSIIQAIILGIVQGITEFLPVSSSGHLAIIQNIFHIQTDGGLFFDVMLHLGTLVAIFVVYRKDILRMIVETVNMCGDIIYNLKSYIQNQRSYSALRYRKIVKTTIASLWYWCWYLPYRQVSLVISEREWWKKRVRH